jgi:hypothetical protein
MACLMTLYFFCLYADAVNFKDGQKEAAENFYIWAVVAIALSTVVYLLVMPALLAVSKITTLHLGILLTTSLGFFYLLDLEIY